MKRIRADRVALALTNLSDWKSRVHAQGSAHLFPLLALLSSGAGTADQPVRFNETPHEFEFWNKHFRLQQVDDAKPYFNPITLRLAEAGFPHSNSATIRKNTFAGKWKAATLSRNDDQDEWQLDPKYAEIFRDKVLSKGGAVVRIPTLDVAVILLRDQIFPDNVNARDLEVQFRKDFPQSDADYDRMFVFYDEESARIFDDEAVAQDYDAAILDSLIADITNSKALPVSPDQPTQMDLDDPILTQVQKLMQYGTSGLIFSGPPGTGKSYYAKRVAKHLVRDAVADIFRVQFHPSYGYEDFVEGYRPDDVAKSGYKVSDKTFLDACRRAADVRGEGRFVVVIVDEINRGDPARVFGELLTYIEQDYRDEEFRLPFSGRPASIPANLILFGTMNPYDRSIAQSDAAFVRRFDHIQIEPSRETAEKFLEDGRGFSPNQVSQIGDWFDSAQKILPFGLGHSYFARIKSIDDLLLVWRYRIKPSIDVALELSDQAEAENIEKSFQALVRRLEGAADAN